jgi:hypothetical protein
VPARVTPIKAHQAHRAHRAHQAHQASPLVIGGTQMNPLTQVPSQTPGKFHVGDRVRILHGFRGMMGEVVEDRGPLAFAVGVCTR